MPVEWPGGELNASFEGAVAKFRSLHINRDTAAMVEQTRLVTEGFTTTVTCPTCEGPGLSPEALACRVQHT